MRTKSAWSAGELVPLADRLRYMLMVRAALIAGVVLCWAFGPGLIGHLPAAAPAVLAGWAGVSGAAEILWHNSKGRGLPLFGATLIVDGAVLVWLSEVGSVTNIRYLVFLHMAAVVLLASYRTGLKMAMWYTLLLSTVFFGGRDGAFGLRPVDPGTMARWDLGQLAVYVAALWAIAIAIAGFSSVNERELRRRRFDLEALARFAVELENAADRTTVAGTLLDNLAGAFPLDRLLLVSSGRRPAVLGHRGLDLAVGDPGRLDPASALVQAQTSRQTLLLAGFDADADPWLGSVLGPGGYYMVVPLYAEGGCVGVLVAEHGSRGGSRAERRLVTIMERFGSQTGLALRNAALLEQMERMANTDGLTHIANHRTFQLNLEKEMARSIRSGEPLSLIMLDLDNFKVLNDSHGHQIGDEVLRQVAVALQASSREFDTIARYGGEEFAVILPGCSPGDAVASAERLRRLVHEGVTSVPVTVSVGVASAPDHGQTAQGLVKAADDAMYLAKRSGRNQVCVAEADAAAPQGPGGAAHPSQVAP